MGHPNLSSEVNRAIAQSEIEGGVNLDGLRIGTRLYVQTKNTLYRIVKVEEGYYISGHSKYCPVPAFTRIIGSTWGGSMLKVGFIGRGMRMEFSDPRYIMPRGTITTSEIQVVTEVQ